MTVELVRGMLQNNEMVAELRILDYRKNRMENDMEAGSRSFDMRCFGPGIPDMGYTAERMGTHSENHDAGDAGYREILAEFCTTSKKIDTEKGLAGYYFQIDGLDENLEFSWTQAKGYEQISDMEGAVRHEDRWMVPRAVSYTHLKYYQCLVAGEIKEKQLIAGFLKKDESTNTVSIYPLEVENSVPIMTEYLPLSGNGTFTLLQVCLLYTSRCV